MVGPRGAQRRLGLAPEDWFWAAWRDLRPLPAPRPLPFDRDAAIERLRNLSSQGWDWGLHRVAAMEPEEAAFWLHAMRFAADTASAGPLLEPVRSATSPESLPGDPAEVVLSIQTWLRHGV